MADTYIGADLVRTLCLTHPCPVASGGGGGVFHLLGSVSRAAVASHLLYRPALRNRQHYHAGKPGPGPYKPCKISRISRKTGRILRLSSNVPKGGARGPCPLPECPQGAPQAPKYFFLTLDKTFTRNKHLYQSSIHVPLVTRGAPEGPMGPCNHPRAPGFLGPWPPRGIGGGTGGAPGHRAPLNSARGAPIAKCPPLNFMH